MTKTPYKTTFLYLICICLFAISACTPKKTIKPCPTFEEMPDPASDTLSGWSQVPSGLNGSLVSTNLKFPKSVAPDIKITESCQITGWKGEKLSIQLLLWTTENINQIECIFDNFTSHTETLSSDIARARFVRYVMTDIFEPGCGYRKADDFPSSLAADMLDNIDCFNIEAKTVRPVWITINIPENAVPGDYKGKIKILAQGKDALDFVISLTVQNRALPPASDWIYHLDLWQHPSAVARVENLPVWSDEHFDAMKPLMKMLANAGQKVITTTLNKDPWNNQCFDKYEDMIVWIKNEDGTWEYDYTVFDKWVNFMMDIGITKMINCYSMVPWNNELHYKDAATGKIETVKADPGTDLFVNMWKPFLKDFTKHLKEKGWLEITNIAMDERSPEVMEATVRLLQETAPELGISLADNHKSYKKYPFIKDMSVAADAKVDNSDLALRKEKGLITTYYVCCSDKFPNVFTFSDPAEAVYSAWYSMAANYDGYLRWAYNSWVENPLTDSRFRTWPAGDTYIVYPEARSSIRFEKLIEGIQDVEKVRILRKELTDMNTSDSRNRLELLNNEVAKFNIINPTEPCSTMIDKARKVLDDLSQ